MALGKLPTVNQNGSPTLADQQWVAVQGPGSVVENFQYDAETNTLFGQESQFSIPAQAVPLASCDNNGLMSADDKCKLDALTQNRLGILGFQGAGFPDDGGWIQGDWILAAGSEFISIERFGNVVRLTVDAPIQLNCGIEACAQIFWVQDETDISAIRPPSCGGVLPGVNSYGELKVYLFPSSAIVNPSNPAATLANKGNYPSFIFKRYDDSVTPGLAEIDIVLQRNKYNLTQTQVGWAFTPGAGGIAECIWYTGVDSQGNQLSFQLDPQTTTGILGGVLCNGNLITRRTAVITDYTPQVLSTNQYTCMWWDVQRGAVANADTFTATNIWGYSSPQGGLNTKALILDNTISILDVGTIVDVWFFQIGEVSGTPIRQHYFSQQPQLKPQNLWHEVGSLEFGDVLVAGLMSGTYAGEQSHGVRAFERSVWGLTGFDIPQVFNAGAVTSVNYQTYAAIDATVPCLAVYDRLTTGGGTDSPVWSGTEPASMARNPVWLWNRNQFASVFAELQIGMAPSPSYDIMLNAAIDSHTDDLFAVKGQGTTGSGSPYLEIRADQLDIPTHGFIRVVTGANAGKIWEYSSRAFDVVNTGVALIGTTTPPTLAANSDVVQLLHEEYSGTCVRLNMANTSGKLSLQVQVGTLDVTSSYSSNKSQYEQVKAFYSGYAVSAIYTQQGEYSGTGPVPSTNVANFVIYDGGYASGSVGATSEYWNDLQIMQRGGQVWIWWNGLIIPPNAALSAQLPTPVTINTPYYPISNVPAGKFGMRMFPGCTVRRVSLYADCVNFSEYTNGQLELA